MYAAPRSSLPPCPPSFFHAPPTPAIYTLSLHDALPISSSTCRPRRASAATATTTRSPAPSARGSRTRSEEHTSELQSRGHLVCRLLLEKKKTKQRTTPPNRTAKPQHHARTQAYGVASDH